ncbi:uncharacterized protein LOC108247922 isoform X3 [Kryptolebias marmoratus]|uniref:uncharacterized protein LOC108247922 isoform X3 n=1 Tax=Kryptolebias marmoratus TaxID=37003 RepID=UPI0018ACE0E9|nr:uncharacterized protein LOC108247922 isoform X3 [Kryptolebias marmoratus]
MRKIVYDGKPHLCLFASEEISPGEEITFSYGESSQEFQSGLSSSNADCNPSSLTPRMKRKRKTAVRSYCEESDGEEGRPSRVRSWDSSLISELDSSEDVTFEEQLPKKRSSRRNCGPKQKKSPPSRNPSFTSLNYCYVCGKGMIKITRHLKNHADEEPDIAKAFSFPVCSAERRKLLGKLRNKGNYQHNKEVLKTNVGVLKAKRRSVGDVTTAEKYTYCPHCKGLFKCLELWRHIANCAKKLSESSTSEKVLEEAGHQVPPDVKKMLSSMSQDGIPLVIQNDSLLLQLATSFTQKFKDNPNKQERIKQKLRELGRFLLELHKKMIFSFEDAIQPKNFSGVVSCMKHIVGFNKAKQTYVKQRLTLRLGNLLKKIGNVVLGEDEGSETMKSHARIFIENCDKEWSGLVSDASLSGQKASSPSTIPFTRDVQTFYKHLEALSASATESLRSSEDSQLYGALCRVTITQTSVLSKSASDVSKMTLKSFQERDDSSQILSKHFVRSQSAAVLLTSQVVAALMLLISKRRACGVHEDNPFLFAKPDSSPTSRCHGGQCIRLFSALCHANNPEHLSSGQNLRHVARIFQILNLENDELQHLAKLLGHDVRADREYYRSPQAAVELAKIAKLLQAMEKGSLERFKGSSLEEVEIEDELEPDVEPDVEQSGGGNDAGKDKESDLLQQTEKQIFVQDAVEHIKTRKDKPFLQEKFIDSFKGRGVFTTQSVEPSTFVVEFRGDVCRREDVPEDGSTDTLNSFLFDFSWNGTNWRLDASAEDGSLGRLVNDDHLDPNCKVMKIDYEGKPHLCLFAQKEISAGEEITFSYGTSSHPWRSEETREDVSVPAASSSVDHRVDGSEESSSYDESSADEYICDEELDSFSESEASSTQQNDMDSVGFKGPSRTNKNFCYVCGKSLKNMARHLFTHRKAEPEIARAFALCKQSKERKDLLRKLLRRGNHKHNQEVLKTWKGCLKARRTSDSFSLQQSAVCIYCKVLCKRKIYWRHLQTCPSKISPPAGSRPQILALVSTGLTNPEHMSSGMRKILQKLSKEEAGSSAFQDTYVLHLAQCLYHGNENKTKDTEIKLKLRLLGKLLSVLNQKSIFSFEDALKPQNFGSVVEAVRSLTGSSKETKPPKRNLTKLATSLRKMADIKYAMALNDGANIEMMKETEEFIKLFAKEWPSNIPTQLKVSCPPTLPFIHDVQKLFRYIDDIVTSAITSLSMYASSPVYTALLRGTVTYVTILNRNVRDVSDVTLESFQKRNQTEAPQSADAKQSQFEDMLSKCTVKVNVSNQKGQKVVLALTPDLLTAITLLVEKRRTCGVPESHPFLFAKPGVSSSAVLKGLNLLSLFLKHAGVKDPESIRSPFFRKHTATVFQILGFSNEEWGRVAELLGRDVPTDTEFYRKPEATAAVARILVLLSAVETGCLEAFEGKALEEIEIPDELQPVVEQNSKEEETSPVDERSRPRRKRKRKKKEPEGSGAENPPAAAPARSKRAESQISFSDDDEDMKVEFNMDIHTDGEDDDDDGLNRNETKSKESSDLNDEGPAEGDEDEGDDWMDGDSNGSCPPRTEKKNELAAMLKKMKEIKVRIPKLNLVVEMNCSSCRRTMMKGHTAYQKKGFRDVFCSKTCLFERFPPVRSASRTCFYCFRDISQPLDLIMAAVDLKGTMKDFCSMTCLCSFKSRPATNQTSARFSTTASTQTSPSLCSACNSSCSAALELKLGEDVRGFCSEVCLEAFCRDAVGVCDVCSSACRQTPLTLRLEDGAKTICGAECLSEFKEDESSHECSLCRFSLPVSKMVVHDVSENFLKLFCSSSCVTSFKVQLEVLSESQSSGAEQRNSGSQRKSAEGGRKESNFAIRDHDYLPAVEMADLARLIIQTDSAKCCGCFKKVLTGRTVYQLKRAKQVFCSEVCVSKKHPHVKFDTRKCYNCCQLITYPQKVILAPADDSGSMKELCSETCLTSIKSKRPYCQCHLCAKYCPCKFSVTVDGEVHRFCSNACVTNFNKENKSSWFICEVCGALCSQRRLVLKAGDDSKTVCGSQCLLKFKETVETRQLCPTCHTPHQLSDMLENPNDRGVLDFFCSHRCMKVYEAQSFPVSEKTSPSAAEDEVKEKKPLLLSLLPIKEEPTEEEFAPDRSESVSSVDVKGEPKEELKIDSVFSLTEDSKPASPSLAHMDLPASCSTCQKVLEDGETVYQRKAHTDLFCSTSCLLRFYQRKPVKKTCHFCLREMKNSQDIVQAEADTTGTKDFCSQTCLSSFKYKRIVSTKLPLVPAASHSQCSVCSRYCISKHEVILQDVVQMICSDPCFHRFCTINNLFMCEDCGARCNTPLRLKTEDGDTPLCSADCLSRFKQKMESAQPCTMCRSSKLTADMVENRNQEDVVELFCSNSCVMASKIQAICASGASLDCDNCRKTTAPVCHLAMSDASIRNFCSLTCAMAFKETQKDLTSNTDNPGAQTQTQKDSDKPPGELLCAQCLQMIKTRPRVIQNQNQLISVCSSDCSHAFQRINNITASCELCKNQKTINEVKRIDNKDCFFCSDGCFQLFLHHLKRMWGKLCSSCSFCLSLSKTSVAFQDEEFCSESCSSKHSLLLGHLLKCDACGRRGRLSESLPLSGGVKRFCDLKCLLGFCRRKYELPDSASSPLKSAGSIESSPIITDVVSLSSFLNHLNASRSSPQLGLFTDIQTKVVGHAGVQTDPKELKNKSMLCVPLVHNKGVSCSVQTVETAAQTVVFKEKVREKLIPVPVPVFVPVPMNMYSQFTPAPVALPLPLPVPVFLSEKQSSSEKTSRESVEENVNSNPEKESEGGDGREKNSRKEDEEETQQTLSLIENISSYRDEFETDLNKQKNFASDSILKLFYEAPPKIPLNVPEDHLPPPPPPVMQEHVSSSNPSPPPPEEGDHSQTKLTNREKLQRFTEEDKQETSNKGPPQMKRRKLSGHRGAEAWRRWTEWRESQTNLGPVSSPAEKVKADLLLCSSSELNVGLCLFIRETRHSADSVFFLCLCIQKYLLENGRLENIFSDLSYQKFSSELTAVLRHFRPSVSAGGNIHSCVEEEFLWGCKQLGASSPIVLLNTLLFFCCKHFGFTTVEQHRQLSFPCFMCCARTNRDGTKTTFLRFYPPTSTSPEDPGTAGVKNVLQTRSSDSDSVPAKKRRLNENFLEMKENKENPLRCPVRLYKFYLSKCSESVRRRGELFYLQPAHLCVSSSPVWFSVTPLDAAVIEAMIVRILAVRKLREEN